MLAREAKVARDVDGGSETVALRVPTCVTTDVGIRLPRLASVPRVMKAKRKPIQGIRAASLRVEPAPRFTLRPPSEPPARHGRAKLADVDELWKELHAQAKIIQEPPRGGDSGEPMSSVLIVAEVEPFAPAGRAGKGAAAPRPVAPRSAPARERRSSPR